MFGSVFLGKFFLYIPVKLVPALVTVLFIVLLYKLLPEGQYVFYSICLTASLISAQVFGSWLGSGFIYYYSGQEDKGRYIRLGLAIALIAACLAGLVAGLSVSYFFEGWQAPGITAVLCGMQLLFFFLSAMCQAAFLVKAQLVAVIVQGCIQLAVLYLANAGWGITFESALGSLIMGYLLSSAWLAFYCFRSFISTPGNPGGLGLISTLKTFFRYGGALMPWMLGMLVGNAVDRFAIGFYSVPDGDAYLSLRDLFTGAAGLISMPLLMLVHPLIVNTFKRGRFAMEIVESSLGFLLIAFGLLWFALVGVGFDSFSHMTGKSVTVEYYILFCGYSATVLNGAAIYVQKRMEVHMRMKELAVWSIMAACLAIAGAALGGHYFGLLGIALAALSAQVLYILLVLRSVWKLTSLSRALGRPLLATLAAGALGLAILQMIISLWPDLEWWSRLMLWLPVYSALCAIALWKGVRWTDLIGSMGSTAGA
jgi:O-antigen/teichoic acid export membrane protein